MRKALLFFCCDHLSSRTTHQKQGRGTYIAFAVVGFGLAVGLWADESPRLRYIPLNIVFGGLADIPGKPLRAVAVKQSRSVHFGLHRTFTPVLARVVTAFVDIVLASATPILCITIKGETQQVASCDRNFFWCSSRFYLIYMANYLAFY